MFFFQFPKMRDRAKTVLRKTGVYLKASNERTTKTQSFKGRWNDAGPMRYVMLEVWTASSSFIHIRETEKQGIYGPVFMVVDW